MAWKATTCAGHMAHSQPHPNYLNELPNRQLPSPLWSNLHEAATVQLAAQQPVCRCKIVNHFMLKSLSISMSCLNGQAYLLAHLWGDDSIQVCRCNVTQDLGPVTTSGAHHKWSFVLDVEVHHIVNDVWHSVVNHDQIGVLLLNLHSKMARAGTVQKGKNMAIESNEAN